MKIKYFAWIKDFTNNEEEEIDSKNITDLNQLKSFIVKKYPDLKKFLNNVNLNHEDEIAVFPPVSGG